MNFYLALPFCPNVNLTLDIQHFSVDLYPLDLSGKNMVLGVHWFSMVNSYIMDYNGPYMRFSWHEKLVELKGDPSPNLSFIFSPSARVSHIYDYFSYYWTILVFLHV